METSKNYIWRLLRQHSFVFRTVTAGNTAGKKGFNAI